MSTKPRAKRTMRWARRDAGPVGLFAEVEGVDASLTSRRTSGQRPCIEAEADAKLRRMARAGDEIRAESIVAGYLASIAEETAVRFDCPDEAWDYLCARQVEETRAERDADLKEWDVAHHRTPKAIHAAKKATLVNIRADLELYVALSAVEAHERGEG